MKAPKSTVITPAMVKNVGCLVKMVIGFTIMLLAGYFALIALNPKARQWATSKKGPTPFKSVNQILAIPAQAIGKTNDVVAASNANVHVLDKVIAEEEGKTGKGKSGALGAPVADPFANVSAQAAALAGAATAGKTGAAAPGSESGDPNAVSRAALIAMQEKLAQLPDNATPEPPKDPAKTVAEAANPYSFTAPAAPAAGSQEPAPPAEVKLPGGIVIANASPAGTPAATAPFLYWVVGLNISGVFQNTPHRILLDKRLVYEGQEVNATLGIVFDHLDVAQKRIVFRDKIGALVTRSY